MSEIQLGFPGSDSECQKALLADCVLDFEAIWQTELMRKGPSLPTACFKHRNTNKSWIKCNQIKNRGAKLSQELRNGSHYVLEIKNVLRVSTASRVEWNC